jgi:serine/threonine protein kinase
MTNGMSSSPFPARFFSHVDPPGDLYTFLHKRQTIPLSKLHRLRMALHCIKGLAFLHTSNYIHRDIKSLNILVGQNPHVSKILTKGVLGD